MPNPILDQARARLSAITAEKADLDVEERELRAMVTAADGVKAQPAPQPFTWPWPSVPIVPTFPAPTYPGTLTPWIVGPQPHGDGCGCGCRGWIYCGAGTTTAELRIDSAPSMGGASLTAQMPAVYRRDAWDCDPAGIVEMSGVLYRN